MTLERLEDSLLFGWDSLVSDIVSDFGTNDMCIANAKNYLVRDDVEVVTRNRLDRLRKMADTYLDLLEKGNRNEIISHSEYMHSEAENIISYIDENIGMVRVDENTDNVEIKERTLRALFMVRRAIQNVINRIDAMRM